MKKTVLLLWTLCVTLAIQASYTVSSPNGLLTVTVSVEQGMASYAVDFQGHQMLQPSRLGVHADIGDFTQGLTLVSTEEKMVAKSYDMTRFKSSHADFHARQLDMVMENREHHRMMVTFLVADHDVAFRYTLYPQEKGNPKCVVVDSEATSFRLPSGTTTFLSPQSKAMVGWERTKPSYEEVYSSDAPMAVPSQFGEGYVFPALFHTPDGWVLISETGVTGGYAACHLSDYQDLTGYTIAYPMAGENNGAGTTTAAFTLPGSTPWRTITVGTTLHPIVETTITQDAVEPMYTPSQDYRPGRYTWSWLIWQDNSMNWDDQLQFIDLAGKMGYEYCLVDALWDTRIGRERMGELTRYARQKGVELLLWYNSNGAENDAPQTPRNCMNTTIARQREMAWLQQIGVKGIKVDFFGGDKQATMQLYEDILADANRFGLQVIFHGCTLPRGWERMYPNYVSSEAVLASENVYFNEPSAQREAYDLTLHPFCRNSVASMDWGGIIMNRFMSRDNKSRHTRKTSDTFELATGITNQSSIQCVALQPNNLSELPATTLDFLRQLPTTWDETRLVEGYPTRYVVLARRHGSQWLVGGLNAEDTDKVLTLSLPMLSGQTVTYYYDDANGQTVARQAKVDKKGRIKVMMKPNGGFIITSSI